MTAAARLGAGRRRSAQARSRATARRQGTRRSRADLRESRRSVPASAHPWARDSAGGRLPTRYARRRGAAARADLRSSSKDSFLEVRVFSHRSKGCFLRRPTEDLDLLGEFAHGLFRKDGPQWQRYAQLLLDAGDRPRGGQRVAPAFEEVVVYADGFELEDILPDGGEGFLGGSLGSVTVGAVR